DSNLMLEQEENLPAMEPQSLENSQSEMAANPAEDGDDEWTESAEFNSRDQLDNQEIPDDMPVDIQWDDIYQNAAGTGSGSGSSSDNDDENLLETRNAAIESLQDHLLWQLNLTPM